MNSLLYFIPFFRPFRRRIAFWFFIYGAYFMAGILTPLAVKIYVDHTLPSKSLPAVWLFAGAYLVYALGLHMLYYTGVQGTAFIIETVVANLRAAVYEKLHRLSIRFFDKSMSGDIVNRVTNDTRNLLNLVGRELVNVSLQVVMGVVSLVILALWNGPLALVVITFIPAYAIIFFRFIPIVRKSARLWRKSSDRLWGNWGEKLQGMAVIQAFTRERREAIRHHVLGHDALDQWYRTSMFGTTMNVLGGFTAEVSRHTAFAIGCLLVLAGHLQLGELLSLGGLIGFILTPVQGLFSLVNTWQQSSASSDRIRKILDQVEEAGRQEGRRHVTRLKGEIRFEHVNFEYEKNRPVLEDLDLRIAPGRNVALVGHTGSGKSTIVHLLQGFYRPQSGAILMDGLNAADIHPRDLRRNIGVVPQDVVLFQDTMRVNIAYGRPDAPEADLWRVLTVAQVDDYVRSLPDGLDTRIGGDEGIHPSEGEAQRLVIARTLLTDPSIVILDEATSSLDSDDERKFQEAVRELLKGRTAIIIAHRLSTIRQCDLVVVLERGRMLEAGNPGDLLRNPASAYRRLYRTHYFIRTTETPKDHRTAGEKG